MAKLDKKRPFGRISSLNLAPDAPAFEQDGILFDSRGKEVGRTPGYERLQAQKLAKQERDRKADSAADVEAVSRRAEALMELGSQVDPHADAQRENAAAENAEASVLDEL